MTTLTDLLAPYLAHAALHLAPRTLVNRRSQLRLLCAELGGRPLSSIGAAELEGYARGRLRLARETTINAELRAYEGLRRWALSQGHEAGPAPLELPERPCFDVQGWTPVEVNRLYDVIALVSPAILPLVVTLANTGMRRGEALALRWSQVDLRRRLIYVWPSAEWQPKSRRPREVPINDVLERLLRELPRHGRFVFTSSTGSRWVCWPQKAFDRARRGAGLRGGPHRLRHTYATEFLAQGGPIAALAQILGHSDERTTRLYGHLRPEHLVAVRNLVRLPTASTAGQKTNKKSSTLHVAATHIVKAMSIILDRLCAYGKIRSSLDFPRREGEPQKSNEAAR